MEITTSEFKLAVEEWRQALGAQHVLVSPEAIDSYGANTNALTRKIIGVIRPSNTPEVQTLVRIANKYRIPLYPISGGRNWGYGSRLPVRNGAVIVDLARMNRVRNEGKITVSAHYALIEPGVTQGQLASLLTQYDLPLVLNATAAGADTSVLGNSLDRGFGYFAMRPDDITGLEVVLGNGEILQTGYGHYENAAMANLYKHGLGPALDGLFFQSNFGIVTCATLHLHPKREAHVTLVAKLRDERDFEPFIDAIADLRRQTLLESVVHIGNRSRMASTLGPLIYNFLVSQGEQPCAGLREKTEAILSREKFASWTAVGGVYGTAGEVTAKVSAIKRRLKKLCTVSTITKRKLNLADSVLRCFGRAALNRRAMLQGAKALVDFSSGTPSDGALLSPLWALGDSPLGAGCNLDDTRAGILFCPPAIPLDGKAAREAVACGEAIFIKFGFKPLLTLNVVNTKTILCVQNLVFDRNNAEQATAAHRCIDATFEAWAKMGIYPYRLGIQSMEQFISASDPFWQTVQSLKKALDPNDVIAPGRYSL